MAFNPSELTATIHLNTDKFEEDLQRAIDSIKELDEAHEGTNNSNEFDQTIVLEPEIIVKGPAFGRED